MPRAKALCASLRSCLDAMQLMLPTIPLLQAIGGGMGGSSALASAAVATRRPATKMKVARRMGSILTGFAKLAFSQRDSYLRAAYDWFVPRTMRSARLAKF